MSFRLLKVSAMLTGLELIKSRGPCVYGWKRQEEWLYIGFSTRGLMRLLEQNHNAFGTFKLEDADEIYIWSPDNISIERLKLIEEALIKELQPTLNRDLTKHKNRKSIKREAAKALFLVENG